MKKGIHPQYHKKAKIICSCGNKIEVGSTSESMEIEVCSACHPFYTGKKKLVDSTGQVDRFKKRMKKASELKESRKKVATKEQKREKKAMKKATPEEPTKKTAKK